MKRLLPLLIALLVLVPTAAASAKKTEIGITDDRMLLAGGPKADAAVAEWKKLGVDNVRIFAQWSKIAPRTQPAGFNGADPATPGYNWFYVDSAVARVRNAGMTVTLTITGPGPVWTSSAPKQRKRRLQAAVRHRTAAFATAVARRYGAQVNRYILWNEPNISTWLDAAGELQAGPLHAGRAEPVPRARARRLPGGQGGRPGLAGDHRRALAARPAPAQRQHGHAAAAVPAPARLPERPLPAHALGRLQEASSAVTGDGFAIHPYSGRLPPQRAHPNPDDVALASVPRLTQDARPAAGRRAPLKPTTRRFGIYIDEYGYQTNPPDKAGGVGAAQAGPLAPGGRVHRLAQLRASACSPSTCGATSRASRRNYSGWQSGLRYVERPGEARAQALRHAVRARRRAQPAVGPGASRRPPHGHRPAPPAQVGGLA